MHYTGLNMKGINVALYQFLLPIHTLYHRQHYQHISWYYTLCIFAHSAKRFFVDKSDVACLLHRFFHLNLIPIGKKQLPVTKYARKYTSKVFLYLLNSWPYISFMFLSSVSFL
jgi:hypothetical protein